MQPAPLDQCPPYCSAECKRERFGQACTHSHPTAAEYTPCYMAWIGDRP